MPITHKELESILRTSFPKAKILLIDTMGDMDHYSLEIEDESFKGQSLVAQHKMVKSALRDVMKTQLHAISIKTSAG